MINECEFHTLGERSDMFVLHLGVKHPPLIMLREIRYLGIIIDQKFTGGVHISGVISSSQALTYSSVRVVCPRR